MAKIIDLDEVVSDDKRVRLGGKVYVLPPDLPVELFLWINKVNDDGSTEVEMVERLYTEILNLFRYKDPKLESLPLSMPQLVTALAKIYGTPDDEPDGDDGRPPRRSRSGGATSSAPRRTKSRP